MVSLVSTLVSREFVELHDFVPHDAFLIGQNK